MSRYQRVRNGVRPFDASSLHPVSPHHLYTSFSYLLLFTLTFDCRIPRIRVRECSLERPWCLIVIMRVVIGA